MSSNVKGTVAEQAIVLAAVKLGVPVLRPVGEHGGCDLAFDIGERLWRVQCKWGRLGPSRDVITVALRTCRCTPSGYVRTRYTEEEVDLIGCTAQISTVASWSHSLMSLADTRSVSDYAPPAIIGDLALTLLKTSISKGL